MNEPAPELSIVVPAFNEALRVGATLEKLVSWAESSARRCEIVVVDDGSHDATAEVVSLYASRGVRLVRLAVNRGKGAALTAGVAASRGRSVLLCDADLSTPIEEVERLESCLEEADLVFGSRALPDSEITRRQPPARVLAGRLFNWAVRLCGVRGVRDTQCGFKLLRAEAAHVLFPKLLIEGFAFDVELLWLAGQHGYRVREVAVEWRDDRQSRVRVVRDGVRMLFDVLRIRRLHARARENAEREEAAPGQ